MIKKIARASVFCLALAASTLLACTGNQGVSPVSPSSHDTRTGGSKAPAAGPTDLAAAARAFVADVRSGRQDLDKEHPFLILGPALYAEVVAHDPRFKKLGTDVAVLDPDSGATQASRACSEATCATFLRAPGLRALLESFGDARYRDATSLERRVILDRSPELLPKDGPATVAATEEQLLAFMGLEGSVWIELISKPSLETFSPASAAPPTATASAIAAAKCLALEAVHLDQAEAAFAENSDAKSLGEGVAAVIATLDALLLAKKNSASGAWAVHLAFGPKGISTVSAPPKALVDPSVVEQLGQRTLHHAPSSRGAELSLSLELTASLLALGERYTSTISSSRRETAASRSMSSTSEVTITSPSAASSTSAASITSRCLA